MAGMVNDPRSTLRTEAVKAADQLYEMLYDTARRLLVEQLPSALGGVPPTHEPPKRQGGEEKPGPEKRLSQERVEEALAKIIELLETRPGGLRSEQIRAELKMDKRLFQYAANLGKTSDQLNQQGERRSTVYSLPTKPSAALTEGRVVKRKKRT